MFLLRASVLILASIIGDNFIIYRAPGVHKAFVCFNERENWPVEWTELDPNIHNGIPIFYATNISAGDNSIIKYKLRYLHVNQSYHDSPWNHILNYTTIAAKTSLLHKELLKSSSHVLDDVPPHAQNNTSTPSDQQQQISSFPFYIGIDVMNLLYISLFVIYKLFYNRYLS